MMETDSPTSREEIRDKKIEAIKKEDKKAQIKKREKKREGTMLLSFVHTCASK